MINPVKSAVMKTKRAISPRRHQAGFSLTETLVSVATGALLITGAAVGMSSISSNINQSGDLASLRSNAISGMRLLRSEVQRSLYLIVKGGSHDADRDYTNLNDSSHPEYKAALDECADLKGDGVFNPLFGMKMAELNTPVLYGLSMAQNGSTYALVRCGPPLSADGRYETENVMLTTILENVGVIPCNDSNNLCNLPKDQGGRVKTLAQIVASMDTSLDSSNKSKIGSFMEPALAIQTDPIRKLLKLVDPTTTTDSIKYSFLQLPGAKRDTKVDLNLLAYARADKVARSDAFYDVMTGDSNASNTSTNQSGCSGITCSFYGIPVNTNEIQLIVDGSGSMSACITWGNTNGSQSRTYFNGSSYSSTKRNCLVTRMESLQNELRNLLTSLPASVSISLQAFSSPGYLNHRQWNSGTMTPLTDSNRSSALAFVNSLSAGDVTRWGGTQPWNALDKAFANANSKTIYFMTDGFPNNDRNGGSWTSSDYQPTANTYINMNNTRNQRLAVNTISIGQDSPWLKLISDGSSGSYKIVDQAYTSVQ
jgi:hypothetical protein